MASETRVVVDTGVVVSAVLLPRSVPRQAFDLAAARGRLLVSVATVAELDEVLRRTKFNKYLTEEKRLEFLAALVREAEVVEVKEVVTECRDPDDNKFLELAVSGKATHILTGDADLLAMHPFRGILILWPHKITWRRTRERHLTKSATRRPAKRGKRERVAVVDRPRRQGHAPVARRTQGQKNRRQRC